MIQNLFCFFQPGKVQHIQNPFQMTSSFSGCSLLLFFLPVSLWVFSTFMDFLLGPGSRLERWRQALMVIHKLQFLGLSRMEKLPHRSFSISVPPHQHISYCFVKFIYTRLFQQEWEKSSSMKKWSQSQILEIDCLGLKHCSDNI